MSNENTLLKEYSNNIIERYIYIDDSKMKDVDKDAFVTNLNRELAIAIQETNAYVKGRTLPYIVVRRIIKDQARIRVIISEDNIEDYTPISEFAKIKDLDIENVSHIVSFKRLDPQNIIRVGDELRPGMAEVWTNTVNQIAAAVDIFLDIAMFNSISYFRDELSIEEKQSFNLIKLNHFNESKLNSYFIIDENAPPSYISFAFAYRTTPHRLDYSGYVARWEEFINSKLIKNIFHKFKIKNDQPEVQIEKHKNPNQLPKVCFKREFWEKYSEGDYLLLRINSLPNTNDRANRIKHYFGITECQVGPIKIVPMGDYFRPDIRTEINEGNISAFKVVI